MTEEVDTERMAAIAEAAKNPSNREATYGGQSAPESRDNAHRAIELRSDVLSPEAGDRLTALVDRDSAGIDSRYLKAVANPAYERAFGKRLINPSGGANTVLDPDEGEAVQVVAKSMQERAMALDPTSAGGYAVPFALDPTMMLTNDGAVNPIRELATVTTIATSTWQGISTAGVTASFADELTEVADGTPTLAQPEIPTEKAQCFVPVSIEVASDWSSLQQELGAVFADAKSNLEASVFIGGTASPQPVGLVTGGTVTVATAGTAAVAVGDIYSLQQDLPPRYQPNASFLASNTISNTIHRLVAKGDGTNAALMSEDRTSILGKPLHEVSTLDSTTTTASKPLVYGDIAAGFRVVDRVGMSIEVIDHVLGASQRPIGARGFYAYWRVGAAVQATEALRVLTVT